MYHRIAGRKLGRKADHKEALMKNLVTSLIVHERIETTVAKAKELKMLADKMITLGKKGDVAAVRLASRNIQTKEALGKLFKDLAPRFTARNGGYTRVLKYRTRKGDGAPTAIIEWVESAEVKAVATEKKASEKKAAPKKAAEKKAPAEKKPAAKKAAPRKKAAEEKA
ncbi:MAG TPA: 50S ribosomal protein L17 [Deltaproteobacteria bacterium]|nr:50S ribosomal protein L17 [Deltaproteobacteria bacterium]HOI06984.1 50S ribosomal protein L17 [Deltaproteobacteria bacterium]